MVDETATLLGRRLGFLLKTAREALGLKQQDVADVLEIDRTTVGRIEAGKAKVRRQRDLLLWLDFLKITDPKLRAEILQLAKEADRPGWWSGANAISRSLATYVGFESAARQVQDFQTVVVPGLLQTRPYATALFSTAVPALSESDVETRVEVRMRRQERVASGHLQVTAVIDESVLYRLIGGETVWRKQIEHLGILAMQPNVRIQILPYDTPQHPGALSSFVILRFDDDPDIAYLESAAGDLFLDGQTATDFGQTFTALTAAALPAEMSRKRILALLDKGVSHET